MITTTYKRIYFDIYACPLDKSYKLMDFFDENDEVYFPISRVAQKCDVLIKICAFNNVFEDVWQLIERFHRNSEDFT